MALLQTALTVDGIQVTDRRKPGNSFVIPVLVVRNQKVAELAALL
ncbi:MAG: hypothetical protein U0V75_04175 [Ferruginibacter sp.]